MPPSVAVLRNGRGSFFCSTASSTDLSVPPQAEGAGGDGTGPGTVEGGRVTPCFLFGLVSLAEIFHQSETHSCCSPVCF